MYLFLGFKHRHLLPAVQPGPYKPISPVLTDNSSSSFCNLLDTALCRLGVDGELRNIKGFDEELLQFLSCELAGEDRLMGLLDLPGDHVLQGGGLQIKLWHKPGSDRSVTQIILSTDLKDHIHCKLSVITICTAQKREKDALTVTVPGSSADVWCDNVLDLLWQSPQDAELGQNMVWTMNQVMLHLDIKVELEVAREN